MPDKVSFTRHLITDRSSAVDLFRSRHNGNNNLVSYKALMRRSSNFYAVKVGLFGSGGRVGQAIQGAGTAVIPGDLSEFRNPARAGIYSALVPGGLPGSRLAAPSRSGRGYRCPEGFQYGGRFTDSRFSTCGQMLFDLFILGRPIGAVITARPGDRRGGPESEGRVNVIQGMSPQEQQVIISRAAQIPRIGNPDAGRLRSSVQNAITTLAGSEDGATLMIRRDGFGLRPVVSTGILRTVPDNRNMEGATFLTASSSSATIGGEELGLLSNTGIQELKYVGPNGVLLTLKKVRPLTVGERRKLGRSIAEIAQMDQSEDPTVRLRALASGSNGAIEYSEDFGKIKKPNDFIDAQVNGSQKRVRRWVYETFMSGRKPRSIRKAPAATEARETEATGKITSVAEAIKHLNNNGDPSMVLPTILQIALPKTSAYRANRISRSMQVFRRRDGLEIRESTSQGDFEHIAATVTADMQNYLGLRAPAVIASGNGRRQPYMSLYPRQTADKITLKPAANLDNLPPEEMLKLAVADTLLDARSRSANNTLLVEQGTKRSLVSIGQPDIALAGIQGADQSRRQQLKLDDLINTERSAFYRQAFKNLTESQRRAVVQQLETILARASDFSWEQYVARLTRDGVLSDAEQTHLRIIRQIFDIRLNSLKDSKESFLDLLGAM